MKQDNSRLRESFRNFDQPVAVPRRLINTLHSPEAEMSASTQIRTAFLAAAMVLLVISGALFSLRFVRSEKPADQSIQAFTSLPPTETSGSPVALSTPQIENAVMFGGTAAQNGSYPGIAPNLESLTKLWSADDAMAGTAFFFGDALYVQQYADHTYQGLSLLTAYEATTGTIRWQTEISLSVRFAVNNLGVYAAQATADSSSYQLVQLDLATGQVRWQSAPIAAVTSPDESNGWLLLSGDTLVASLGNHTLTAYDTGNGAVRWRHTPDQPTDLNCQMLDCSSHLAIGNGAVYQFSLLNNRLIAYDLFTGAERWQVAILSDEQMTDAVNTSATLTARASDKESFNTADLPFFTFFQLAATEYGPVLIEERPDQITNPNQIRLYDGMTGVALWTHEGNNNFVVPAVLLPHAILSLTGNPGDSSSVVISPIDLVSGVVGASQSIPANNIQFLANLVSLPQSGVMIAGANSAGDDSSFLQRLPVIGSLFGAPDTKATLRILDPVTLDELGSITFTNCYVTTTFSDDGKVVCIDTDGTGFSVYGSAP